MLREMTTETVSRGNRITTWLVIVLSVVLLAAGWYWYGWSEGVRERFWDDLFGRPGGPMSFRFVLQPIMAAIAALHDGIADARYGHRSFFWSTLRHPERQSGRLREGLISTSRIVLLGISIDVIYQIRVFGDFYPGEALTVALLLALIPYFVFRWIVERFARRRLDREERVSRQERREVRGRH